MKLRLGSVLILLFFATVLLITLPAYASAAYVQGDYDEDSGSTANVTLQSSVTAGNFLLVVLRMGGNETATCVNDGDTFIDDEIIGPINGDWMVNVQSLANISGNSDTVTCTLTGSVDLTRISVMEFSGMATNSSAVDTAENEGMGGNQDAGNVTVTEDSLIVVAMGSDSDELKNECTPGSGYTIVGDFGLGGSEIPDKTEIEYKFIGSGTYSGDFSGVSIGDWAAISVAYSASGDADTVSPGPASNVLAVPKP